MYRLYSLIVALLAFTVMQAQDVVINEYSASNLTDYTDQHNKTEDWIELYNTTDQDIDLSGWHLSDKSNKPEKWDIPNGVTIPANGHLVFYCSGRDKVFKNNQNSPPEYHTNFKISQTKGNEVLILSTPDAEVVQEIPYELTLILSENRNEDFINRIELTEPSRCRVTDGANEWMICNSTTLGYSNGGSDMFVGYTATPQILLDAGFYDNTVMVSITNVEPNSVLRYTKDGTNPTESSPEYTDPIEVSSTTVIKARAYSNDPMVLPGKMDFATYFINEESTLAVFSIAADGVTDLANNVDSIESRQYNPVGSLEYFDVNGNREAISYGTLNRHGQDSWALQHRSIDWVSRDEMGYSKAVQAQLFEYSDRDEYQRLIFRASGDDNYPARNADGGFTDGNHQGSTHIRDEYVHTLAQEGGMKVDVRAVERVAVFLNGQFWGIYGMRERPVDHDYIKEYYDQDKQNIQFLSTWGQTEAEYGGYVALHDWLQFREFIMNNDMGDETNYQYVKDHFQVQSLIDYMIVNLNSVAKDWLNYNTGWWRGIDPEGDHKKWGYIIWDMDATFGYYINYTGVPNEDPNAEPCDIDEISDYMDQFFGGWGGNNGYPYVDPATCLTIDSGSSPYGEDDPIFNQVINEIEGCCTMNWGNDCQAEYDHIAQYGTNTSEFLSVSGNIGKHEKIFLKLQEENPEFRQLYYSRLADMMNTVYTCENMTSLLNRMVAVIEPEMPKQIARWGGSMAEWQSNVSDLRAFIEERCTLLDDGMECFEVDGEQELNGPYELTLNTMPEGVGEIDLNTLDIREMPWSGKYFGGMDNKIKARAFDEDEYYFSHWETANSSEIADVNGFKTVIRLTQDEELTAVFTTEPVGTQETNSGHTFDIFPNPAHDYVILDYTLTTAADVSVALYNAIGTKVSDISTISNAHQAGRYTHRIDLEAMSLLSGMYYIEVRANDEHATLKVIVTE